MKKIVESYDEFLNEAKAHKIIDKLVVAIQNSDMGGDDDEVDQIILDTVLEVVGDDKKVIDALQKLLKDMTDDEDDMDESKSTVTEGVGKGHPDIVRVMREIEEWDADMMENLLSDIATNYKINADELDNMDAMGIYKHIMEAVKLLKKRTGN